MSLTTDSQRQRGDNLPLKMSNTCIHLVTFCEDDFSLFFLRPLYIVLGGVSPSWPRVGMCTFIIQVLGSWNYRHLDNGSSPMTSLLGLVNFAGHASTNNYTCTSTNKRTGTVTNKYTSTQQYTGTVTNSVNICMGTSTNILNGAFTNKLKISFVINTYVYVDASHKQVYKHNH
jgi:hypothetical protein